MSEMTGECDIVEYMSWMKDEQPALDKPIVVEIEGTQIRFKNDEAFADWLSEMLSK